MISEKIKEMLASNDSEIYQLGMTYLRQNEPSIWAALLSYTGIAPVTGELLGLLSRMSIIHMGYNVRYRGLDDSPTIVVTEVNLAPQTSKDKSAINYKTMVSGKYFCTKTNTFVHVQDRFECFEIIDKKK